jgi:hypothetical protein
VALADPLRVGEAEDEGSVEAECALEVEVLDAGVEMEPGLAE